MNPFPSYKARNAPDRFDHVIGSQGNHGEPCRPVENQTADTTQRDGYDPHEENVCDHQEFGISAAAQHAFGHNGLNRLEEDDEYVGVHKLFGDDDGFLFQIVCSDGQWTEDKDQHSTDSSKDHTEDIEGFSLLLC